MRKAGHEAKFASFRQRNKPLTSGKGTLLSTAPIMASNASFGLTLSVCWPTGIYSSMRMHSAGIVQLACVPRHGRLCRVCVSRSCRQRHVARLDGGLAEDLLRRRARVHVVAHLIGPQMDEVLQIGHLPPGSKVRAGSAALARGFWCAVGEKARYITVCVVAPARDGHEAIEGHARSANEVSRVAAVQRHGIRPGKSSCAQR